MEELDWIVCGMLDMMIVNGMFVIVDMSYIVIRLVYIFCVVIIVLCCYG